MNKVSKTILKMVWVALLFVAPCAAQTYGPTQIANKVYIPTSTSLKANPGVNPNPLGCLASPTITMSLAQILNCVYDPINGALYVTLTSTSGMTWPAGGAGIPNYNGSSAWGTSYSASNKIPASFVSFASTDLSNYGSVSLNGLVGATPSLGTDNSVAGTLQLANGSANAHTIWASGATTSNTIKGPATVVANGHLLGCSTTGTVCTITDITVLANGTTATTQSQNDNSLNIATTQYTDLAVANAVAGVNPAVAVLVATTAAGNTSAWTYANGASGVGATFTGPTNTAITIDGVTFTSVGQRLLVKNDTQSPSGAFNGVYQLTALQTGITGAIFTRVLDYTTPSDINNTGTIPVQSGTANTTTSWLLTSQITTVGTSPLTYAQFSWGQPTFSALSGSLACSQTPAYTGDATKSSGGCATIVVALNGTNFVTGNNVAAHNFFGNGSGSAGNGAFSRPTCSDLSDAAASCNTNALSATNISSGTLANGRLANSGVTPLNGANITLGTGGQVPVFSPCSEGVAQFATTGTLTNDGTSEQFFTPKCTIAANYFTANRAVRVHVTFDMTPTATVPTYVFRMKLCTSAGSGCTNIYQSIADTPGANTISSGGWTFVLQGTAAAGGSVAVESAPVGFDTRTFATIGRWANNQATQVAALATNGQLFLQFTIQFGGTGSNNPVTLTQLIVEGLN